MRGFIMVFLITASCGIYAMEDPNAVFSSRFGGNSPKEGGSGENPLDAAFRKGQMASPDLAVRQMAVGDEYRDGTNGRTRDLPQAKAWYEKSAAGGHVPAMLARADLSSGEERMNWLYTAVQRGSAEAAGVMAIGFMEGSKGLPQNLPSAMEWADRHRQMDPSAGEQTVTKVRLAINSARQVALKQEQNRTNQIRREQERIENAERERYEYELENLEDEGR